MVRFLEESFKGIDLYLDLNTARNFLNLLTPIYTSWIKELLFFFKKKLFNFATLTKDLLAVLYFRFYSPLWYKNKLIVQLPCYTTRALVLGTGRVNKMAAP
jgi:hypothetical protein